MHKSEPQVVARHPCDEPDALPRDLHPVLRRVLRNRGVNDPQRLALGLDAIHKPHQLHGIQPAAALLADALAAAATIRVVGDFDADGATGTAVAVRALRMFGHTAVDFAVPNRFDFGYGLSVGLVETFRSAPPALILTVDSGISSGAGVARARELGCQVVITDHHIPGLELPQADAIVNPNLPGDDFPSKALAGVGVVFYLMAALRQELKQRGWFNAQRREPNLGTLLDLVALGTVADLVALDDNNRVLVHQGLRRIRAGHACAGIQALLEVGRREPAQVVASDLGFVVGPRLNAAGRLEDMTVGIRCLLSDDPAETRELAQWLDTLNRERQALQSEMEQQAQQIVGQQLQQLEPGTLVSGDNSDDAAAQLPLGLCLFQEDWHQGVVGLVAARIKEALHRPVIAFAPEAPGAHLLKGSARSIPGVHIRDVLAHVDALQPGLMRAFGGHAMAAGLSLDLADLERFRHAFHASLAQLTPTEALQLIVETDGELSATELNLDVALALRESMPWGQQFPEPLFQGAFKVLDQQVVGAVHLRLRLCPWEGGHEIDAIAFNTRPEQVVQQPLHLLYRLGVNYFRGVSCQLVVERILR